MQVFLGSEVSLKIKIGLIYIVCVEILRFAGFEVSEFEVLT